MIGISISNSIGVSRLVGGTPTLSVTTAGYVITGQTLTATASETPDSYQWARDGSDIAGATSSTYTVTPDDESEEITCTVIKGGDFAVSLPLSNFSPKDTTTLRWFDSTDADTTNISTGTSVSNWLDKSANADSADQTIATRQPQLGVNTLNGLDLLTFDGVDDGFLLDSPIVSESAVYAYFMIKGFGYFISSGSTDRFASFATNETYWVQDDIKILNGVFLTLRSTSAYQINEYITDTTGSEVKINSLSDTSRTRHEDVSIDRIGLKWEDTTSIPSLDGDVGDLIITTSSTDEDKIVGYLAWKWGLVADLPAAHPYKLAPA